MKTKNGRQAIDPAISDGPQWRKLEVIDWTDKQTGHLKLELRSTMPMLQNNFPARIRQEILRKQQGIKSTKKEPKDVEVCFLEAMIVIGKQPTKADLARLDKIQFAMPAVAFKDAAITAAAQFDDEFKTDARASFWIETESGHENKIPLRLEAPPYPREDVARNKGTIDVRIRPCFDSWRATLTVGFVTTKVSPQRLIGWFRNAGRSVGVGDWRLFGKASTGMFGGFDVVVEESMILIPSQT